MALTASICGRCRTQTFGGWTREPCALLVTLDAAPLTPEGELAAAVAGCRTWTLHTAAGVLTPRPPSTIRERPAGSRPRQSVHAEHRCPAPPRSQT